MFKNILAFFSMCSLLSCSTFSSSETMNDNTRNLNTVIKEYTEASKRIDAFNAPYFNVEEDLPLFGDYLSLEYFARSQTVLKRALTELQKVNPGDLSKDDLRSYLLFKENIEISLRRFDFPNEFLENSQMDNRFRNYINDSSPALTSFPFDSAKHYDDFVKRASGFPAYVDRKIEIFKRGVRNRIVLNCIVARKFMNSYEEALIEDVSKNPFFRPVLHFPKTLSAFDQSRLTSEFQLMIQSFILPSFKKFDHFFKTEYLPHCRNTYGIGTLPNGKAWYEYSIKASTGLDLSPKKIHDIGLSEVARISAEMNVIRKKLKFNGSLKDFLRSLIQDPSSYFKTPAALLEAFEKVKKSISQEIPRYFNLIPNSDYKIVEAENPEDPAASYQQPTEIYPFGRFLVNTKNMKATPIFGVTTLSLHEAVPGHHFQLALQFEQKDRLSEYQRKMFYSTSYVEGWALYAEYLGNEMGAYSDPLQKLGNLNDEMLRAVRLVLDTGIHAFDWTRDRAIEYMTEHLASEAKDIETEVDRYSVWPGQALAYKLGQLKIIELRKLAEKELGSKFDIRKFHDVVIGNGTLSLGVLENEVKNWIKAENCIPQLKR